MGYEWDICGCIRWSIIDPQVSVGFTVTAVEKSSSDVKFVGMRSPSDGFQWSICFEINFLDKLVCVWSVAQIDILSVFAESSEPLAIAGYCGSFDIEVVILDTPERPGVGTSTIEWFLPDFSFAVTEDQVGSVDAISEGLDVRGSEVEISVEGVCDGFPVIGAIYCSCFAGLTVQDGKVVTLNVGSVFEIVGIVNLFKLCVVLLGECESGEEEEDGQGG